MQNLVSISGFFQLLALELFSQPHPSNQQFLLVSRWGSKRQGLFWLNNEDKYTRYANKKINRQKESENRKGKKRRGRGRGRGKGKGKGRGRGRGTRGKLHVYQHMDYRKVHRLWFQNWLFSVKLPSGEK